MMDLDDDGNDKYYDYNGPSGTFEEFEDLLRNASVINEDLLGSIEEEES